MSRRDRDRDLDLEASALASGQVIPDPSADPSASSSDTSAHASTASTEALIAALVGDSVHALDELLRRSMHALDAQTPAGTFEALPAAIAARLAEPPPPVATALATAVAPQPPSPRRSSTLIGAPPRWWQSPRVALACALVAAVALTAVLMSDRVPVTARPGRDSSIGASSADLGDPLAHRRLERAALVQLQAQFDLLRVSITACMTEPLPAPSALSVDVVVAASGAVSEVAVRGALAGSATARCLEAVVRRAKVSPWRGAPVSLTVPLVE
jgi:hypothetical protein